MQHEKKYSKETEQHKRWNMGIGRATGDDFLLNVTLQLRLDIQWEGTVQVGKRNGLFQARNPHSWNYRDGKQYSVLDKWRLVQLGKYWQVGEGRKAERVDWNLIMVLIFNHKALGLNLQIIGSHRPIIVSQYYATYIWKNAQRNEYTMLQFLE